MTYTDIDRRVFRQAALLTAGECAKGAGRGDLVAFGSSLPHQVTRVTSGERWVLLAWGYCNHHQRPIR